MDRQVHRGTGGRAHRPQEEPGGSDVNTDTTTQVYQIVIKASPDRIWEAITTPEWSVKYFHGARITNTAQRHISYGPDGSVWGDGEVYEWDPPRRFSHEWQSRYDEELGREEPSRVTWEI